MGFSRRPVTGHPVAPVHPQVGKLKKRIPGYTSGVEPMRINFDPIQVQRCAKCMMLPGVVNVQLTPPSWNILECKAWYHPLWYYDAWRMFAAIH